MERERQIDKIDRTFTQIVSASRPGEWSVTDGLQTRLGALVPRPKSVLDTLSL